MKYSITITATFIVAAQSIFTNVTCDSSTDCQSDEWCYEQWQCVPKCNIVDGVNCTADIGANYACNDMTGECYEMNCNNTADYCALYSYYRSTPYLLDCNEVITDYFVCQPRYCGNSACPEDYICHHNQYCVASCTSADYSCGSQWAFCNATSGSCVQKECNVTSDCPNENGYCWKPYILYSYGYCQDLCASDDDCYHGFLCNTDNGECERETCLNSDDPDYCLNLNGPQYPQCKEAVYNGQVYGYCGVLSCVDDANCTSVIGDGYICHSASNECMAACTNNTYCMEEFYTNSSICNDITGQCEFPCSYDTDCWHLEYNNGGDWICNADTSKCEKLSGCIEDPSECTELSEAYGFELQCDASNGECRPTYCYEDCADDYVCYQGYYCLPNCATTDFSCGTLARTCDLTTGSCVYRGCNTTMDCDYGNGEYCSLYGSCLDPCTSADECPQHTTCDLDIGQCVRETCGNSADPDFCVNTYGKEYSECIVIDGYYYYGVEYAYCSQPTCVFESDCDEGYICGNYGEGYQDFCEEDCRYQNETFCANYYDDPTKACSDYGYCDSVQCDLNANCTEALGDGFVCNQGLSECVEACIDDSYCGYNFALSSSCNVDSGECELACTDDGDCWELDDRYSGTFWCNDATSECERYIACVEDPTLCPMGSAMYGIELQCNTRDGYCDPFACNSTNDCSLTDSFCAPLVGFPLYIDVCQVGCANDLECAERFGDSSDFNFVCNETTMQCEAERACITDCAMYSEIYGIELECGIYDDYCVPVWCSDTNECSLDGSICTSVNGFGFWSDVCYVPCTNDMECDMRFGNFSAMTYCGEDDICTNMTDVISTTEEVIATTKDTDSGVAEYAVSALFGMMSVMISWIL